MKLVKKIFRRNTLYYPGCLTKFVGKDLLENYRKILHKIKVDFIELKELEACCGSPVLKTGFVEDFRVLAEKNFQVFKQHSVGKIISNCPACVFTFKEHYPKILGERWDIEVEHITQAIKNSKFQIPDSKFKSTATYHDPCHLGRQLGIYDAPREIIKQLGFELIEMSFSKELSFCCGGGGGIKAANPELSEKISKERLFQTQETGARILVTACPMCHLHLQEQIKKLNGINIQEKELSELILETLT